jgi:hypothetical protein
LLGFVHASPGVKCTIGVPAVQMEAACVTLSATPIKMLSVGPIDIEPGVAPAGTVAVTVDVPKLT